jgi:predicted SprT family Zn-dependent metalloprotease
MGGGYQNEPETTGSRPRRRSQDVRAMTQPNSFGGCTIQAGPFAIAVAKRPLHLSEHFYAFKNCVTQYDVRAACTKLADLRNTHLCIFKDRKDMNLTFYRASHYIEVEPVILTDEQLKGHTGYDGHDLLGKDLENYYERYNEYKTKNSLLNKKYHYRNKSENNIEERFKNAYLDKNIKSNTVIITAFLREDIEMIVSHEIHHAHFYTDRNYQKAVINFWDNELENIIGKKKKEQIASEIGKYYNIKNHPIILYNEFQAYALQLPLQQGRQELVSLLQPFKEPLTNFLTQRGVPPLEFSTFSMHQGE